MMGGWVDGYLLTLAACDLPLACLQSTLDLTGLI